MAASPMSMSAFFLQFVPSQFSKIPYPTTSFAHQTVILTGSNTGLGLEAARHIVRLGAAKVILAVRTVSKGQAAAADILKSTGATKDVIEVWPFDLGSYESIKSFADRAKGLERLDAVVQNAGILTKKFNLVGKGDEAQESHIRVNVLGALLLGLLLLPKLRETGVVFSTKTRLSFVGSDLMYVAAFKEALAVGPEDSLLEALRDEKITNMDDRYPVSKLLLTYSVRYIAAHSPVSPSSPVIIDVMTPGACKSDIFRDDTTWIALQFQKLLGAIFARTTEVGGRILVHAVQPDLGDDAHGAFLMDCRVAKNGGNVESARGNQLARRWNKEVFAKLEEIAPGITKVLE